jgi:hypothetical protein
MREDRRWRSIRPGTIIVIVPSSLSLVSALLRDMDR